jgi:hypothetical protein
VSVALDIQLNTALDGPAPGYSEEATLEQSVNSLSIRRFRISQADEAFAEFGFLDIGALVFYLKAVSWQVPGFDVVT